MNKKTKKLTFANQYFATPYYNAANDSLILESERQRINISISNEKQILNPNKNYRINVTIHELES